MNYHNKISMNMTYMTEMLKINTYSLVEASKGTAVEWQFKKKKKRERN